MTLEGIDFFKGQIARFEFVPRLPRKVPRLPYAVWVCVKLLYVKYVCVWSYCARCEFVPRLPHKVPRLLCATKLCVWVCVKLLYVKFVCVWSYCMLSLCVCLCEVMVCERLVCDKVVYVLVCVKLLYVKFVCVWSYGMWHVWRWRREAGGGGADRSRPGIQNQKQEPHTKLWGNICNVQTLLVINPHWTHPPWAICWLCHQMEDYQKFERHKI